ncbi:methyltransferase [Sediminibacterium sp. TEGAF015]|uniref:methyltransferase n=1 Tax=Sediminibacterium sp. TEGAF015 TaxID=575378 RepID=UPI00220A5055|nr:methyltransferase [Sediminibacterium sp. TEGAF015]BDQ12896.1 hypothetical protein TEGAF0_21130 [Sediminibacterium sp. TEGAF015]
MNYPIILQSFASDLNLYIPDPQKIQSVFEEQKAQNPAIDFPFWAKCWSSSFAMLKFLQNHAHYIQHKSVVELGAGIGLPSFFAANRASSVTITDYAEEALDLMRYNIAALQLSNTQVKSFNWNDYDTPIQAEVVLLSDVNYDQNDFASLKLLLHAYLKNGATILLATPHRINASSFVLEFLPYVQEQELISIEMDLNECMIGLFVFQNPLSLRIS